MRVLMTDIDFVRTKADFTKAEKKLINYIITNPDDFIHMTIGDVAEAVGISLPTVSRFARHCGYADFKELKHSVYRHISKDNPPAGKLSSTLKNEDTGTPAGFLRRQQYCIEKTLEFLDTHALEEAVHAILNASTVYLYAKGASLSMAELLRFRMNRFGKRTVILPAGSSELFEYLNFFSKKDLVILFGFQKTPQEARVILDYQKGIGFHCILFTDRLYHSPMSEAVLSLYVYRGDPSEYHSMCAPAAVLDALIVMLGARLGETSARHLDNLYKLKEHYKTEIPR